MPPPRTSLIELQPYLVRYASIPVDWYPISVSDYQSIPQSVKSAGMYQDYCYIYKRVFVADILNGHSSSRTKLQLLMLKTSTHLEDHRLNELQSLATITIQDLAGSICACVPYYLGDRVKILTLDDKTVQ